MQSMHGCDPSNGTGMYEKSARTVNQDALGGEGRSLTPVKKCQQKPIR